MKNNLTRLLLVLCVSALIISCKKDKSDSPSGYYVKIKIDGNWITYKTALGDLGPDLADDSKTDLGVSGYSDDQKEIFNISIQRDDKSFPTGTYNTDDYYSDVSYSRTIGTELEYYALQSKDGLEDAKYTINITSINEKEIRGNFTGNYLYDFASEDIKHITEGEFFVKRIR